jgi:antitoxin YefM
MEAITYTALRDNLARTMDEVTDHHEPVIVTRQKAKPVVMMSLDDYNSLMETVHLLKSPRNAARLMSAIHAVDKGQIVQHDLIETDDNGMD